MRKQKLRKTEKRITEFTLKQRDLSEKLSDPGLYAGDTELIVSLKKEHADTSAALEQEETAWIAISEQIERET